MKEYQMKCQFLKEEVGGREIQEDHLDQDPNHHLLNDYKKSCKRGYKTPVPVKETIVTKWTFV